MDSKLLPCVELEPKVHARASVVWLHGLGADGHDFVPIVPELGLPDELGVRFVFPHAPSIPVAINGGFVMPAWYDIRSPELGLQQDELGMRRSIAAVEALLERERERGIPSARTVLAGFSQGGAIALAAGLRQREPLAGILALSTYMVLGSTLQAQAGPQARSVPILQAHGRNDPMVRFERGEEACAELRAAGHAVEFRAYPMQHEVCLPEIRDIGRWLGQVLAGTRPLGQERVLR